jgi:hypothetical protein
MVKNSLYNLLKHFASIYQELKILIKYLDYTLKRIDAQHKINGEFYNDGQNRQANHAFSKINLE